MRSFFPNWFFLKIILKNIFFSFLGLSQWRNKTARSEDEGPEFVMPTYQMLHIAEVELFKQEKSIF